MLTEKQLKFQKKLVKDLLNGKLSYHDASAYTILAELIESVGLEEVEMVFEMVKKDFGYVK